MVTLKRKIERQTAAVVHECGRARHIIVALEPPALLVLRAKGCQHRFTLDLHTLYYQAARNGADER